MRESKCLKCDFGYLERQTKKEITKTILLFGISISIFVIGIIVTKIQNPEFTIWLSRYNMLTLAAVLGLLPAARQFTSMFMFVKNKKHHLDEEKHNELLAVNQDFLHIRYDLFMTSYDNNFPILSMTMAQDTLIGYTERKDFKFDECYKHIKSMLAKNGLKAGTIKIFDDFAKYKDRVKALSEAGIPQTNNEKAVLRLMENLSL